MTDNFLPALPAEWEATRATLHAYANAVGVIPRVHAVSHPKWWHISLKVRPTGLVTDAMALPGSGTFQITMDLRNHQVVIDTSTGVTKSVSMTDGLTGTEFGDRLIAAVADLGVEGEYLRKKFESNEAREYDAAAASAFFDAIVNIDYVFEEHRSTLEGDFGPLQLWPHGFDLAFEWMGTKTETYDDVVQPSQLNLGWYPGGEDAYFYSNPWPFDKEALLDQELPHGAVWHTEGWEGTMLCYNDLVGDPKAHQKLLDFAKAVYKVAAPTLMA